jgi:hypothetical protein
MFRPLSLLILALLAPGCAGGGSAPRPAQQAAAPAEWKQGQLHIRASTTPTWQLDPGIARGYGIPRSDEGVLLLVAVREGPEGAETTRPAQVSGWATDLQGRRRELAFRELRTAAPGAAPDQALVDHITLLDVRAPDTLHFHLKVTPRGDSTKSLDFVREFHPR